MPLKGAFINFGAGLLGALPNISFFSSIRCACRARRRWSNHPRRKLVPVPVMLRNSPDNRASRTALVCALMPPISWRPVIQLRQQAVFCPPCRRWNS